MSSSRRLSPRARPLIKQVLPAPRSPISPSSSPPSSSDASLRPHDFVSCAERLSITIVTTVAPDSVAALAIAISHFYYTATTQSVLPVLPAARQSGRRRYSRRAPSAPRRDPPRSHAGRRRARARQADADAVP